MQKDLDMKQHHAAGIYYINDHMTPDRVQVETRIKPISLARMPTQITSSDSHPRFFHNQTVNN